LDLSIPAFHGPAPPLVWHKFNLPIVYFYLYLCYSAVPLLKVNDPIFVMCYLFMFPLLIMQNSWGSSVSVVTELQTGLPAFGPWERQMISLLASASRLALGPIQPPVQWLLGLHTPGVNTWPKNDADHSAPSSANVKNE
jgi:hypothetical protein